MMKVVVFGNGHWGRNYVRELGNHLVAVVEPDPEQAKLITDVPVYPELPNYINYDAAIIATPPDTHVELALPIVRSGRFVLIEKPLAPSVDEAVQLWPYKDKCMVMNLYAYHPVMVAMRRWINEHGVDHIYTRRTNHGPVRPWQSALWDLASHDIAILNQLLPGRVMVESVVGSRDWSVLAMRYEDVRTISYVSWLGRPKQRVIELVPQYGEERFVFDDVNTVLDTPPLTTILDVFLSGKWDRCTLEEGVAVVSLLEEASRKRSCRCQ